MQWINSLVICEDKSLTLTLISHLQLWGIEATSCAQGNDMVACLKKTQPNLVIIDQKLYKNMALSLNNIGALTVKNAIGIIVVDREEVTGSFFSFENLVTLPRHYTKAQLFNGILKAMQLNEYEPIWASRISPLEEINAKFAKLFGQIQHLKEMAETPVLSIEAERMAYIREQVNC